MMDDPFQALRKMFERYAPIPDAEWELFRPALRPEKIEKGKVWIEIGQDGDAIAFLLKGLMRNYYVMADGNEYTRAFRAAGQFVASYSSALSGEVSQCAVEAVEDCEVLTFSYREFKRGFARHACWERIARVIGEEMYIEYQKREYELLCMDALTRYEAFQSRYSSLHDRLSQSLIASYLGITPVSLSRLRGKRARKDF